MTVKNLGDFDYIVVGAGSAGCVLANRLSADPSVSVLLLEAGGRDDYFWIHVPVGYLYTMNNPRTDWCFKTEPQPGLNGRCLDYPRGKVLGGCSAINGMIYMRGQAADYYHWRQLGNLGWSWEDVLPYFRCSEDHFNGANEFHGAGGEWRVEAPRVEWDILNAFREAAAQVGIPKVDDFNTGDNEGCGYYHVNQRTGIRWTSAKGFLRPAQSRPNLTVLTRAQVTKIVLSEQRAAAVEFMLGDQAATAAVSAELILASGAVASPQLLELSGIGQGERLQRLGIQVAHELPGVGENLQDHLQLRPAFRVSGIATLNERSHSWTAKAKMALEYALFRRGPLTMAPSQLGCFAKSDPTQATANLQYHVQPLSTVRLGDALDRFPAFTASVCNLRPKSRGYVHAISPDPRAAPSIMPNYLSDAEDRRVAADSIRLTRKICAAPALAKYSPQEFKPGPELESDAELAAVAGDSAATIFHPVGTCKMGSDAQAVVDARLRVHGIARLRVVDASIMPAIVSGNTNSPTIMIAEKAAAMILEDRRSM